MTLPMVTIGVLAWRDVIAGMSFGGPGRRQEERRMPRPIVVATTALLGRYGASVADNVQRGLDLLDLAGAHRPDLACLPELFPHAGVPIERLVESAQPAPGPL